MIKSRCTTASGLAVTIRPSFEPRANAPMPRSISVASCTLIGVNSTPKDGATAWMAPYCPVPAAIAGSRMTATLVMPGATCFSSSSSLPLRAYSESMNPVALPPGRARLSTKPAPIGSTTCTKTIGTLLVAFRNSATTGLVTARMTSGKRAANSAANLRRSSTLPAADR